MNLDANLKFPPSATLPRLSARTARRLRKPTRKRVQRIAYDPATPLREREELLALLVSYPLCPAFTLPRT